MGGHAADLPVAPFADRDADPSIWHRLAKPYRRITVPHGGRGDAGHLGSVGLGRP